jgi:putative MATE family efflux protein
MNTTGNFTEGKIIVPLISFALPVLCALLLQTMYGAVDLLVVGQFGTAAQVSAVSTGSWVMQTVTVLITGLSMGTTILLGHKIGQNKATEGSVVTGTSIFIFILLGTVLTVLMLISAPAVSRLMHAPEEAQAATVDYIRICSSGTLCIISYNVLGSIFRGMGNSRIPLIAVAIACILNIGGDLLLVAGFGMGAAGAAAATVFAQAVSVAACGIIISRMELPFKFSVKNIRWQKETGYSVLKLGTPVALQDTLVSISFLAVTAIINSLGVTVSAGVGIAEKICGFIMLVPSAYMQAMSAFVAQNIGAGKPQRAKKALYYAVCTSLCIGLFLSYLSFFHGTELARLFSNKADIIAAAAEYLKAYAFDCLLVSFLFCFIGYFNGCGRTAFVMAQGIFGSFFVRIPISYLMSRRVPASLFHIGLATPASSLVQIILCAVFYMIYARRDATSFPLDHGI